MTETYINNILVDTQDAEIAFTFQALSFENLGSRKGSYSNTFELAKTNANKALFDNCHIVASLTALPYQLNTFKHYIDGMLVVDGTATIRETGRTYRLFVSAGNTDFFKSLAAVKLVEVDLASHDHLYSTANVSARRATPDGFVYPNIDYGFFEYADPAATLQDFRFFHPSFWAKTILLKAIEDAGYTLHGDLLSTLTWRNLAVICRGAVADILDSLAQYKFTIDYNKLTGTDTEKINFPDRVSDKSSLYFSELTAGQFVYHPNVTSGLQAKFEISFTGKVITNLPRRYTNALVYVDLIIYNAAGTVLLTLTQSVQFEDRFKGPFNVYKAPASGTLERDLNFTFPGGTRAEVTAFNNLLASTPDYTTLRFGWQVRSNRPGYGLKYLRFENLEFIINQKPGPGRYGAVSANNVPITVKAVNVLPATPTVGDLFLTIINLEGVLVQVDETSKKIRTAKLDSIVANKAKALDWSGKLDLTEVPTVGYSLDGFARKNYYSFAGDDKDELLEPDYGRGMVEVVNVNLEAEKTIFSSKFSPIPVLPSMRSTRTMGKVFTGDKYRFDGFTYILNEETKITDFGPRIAILAEAAVSLEIIANANTINYEVNASALSFSRALADNYGLLRAVLDNTKKVDALYLLDLADVQKLDFSVPIFDGYFGDYFYIQEIKQFKVNKRESCLVSLVKLGI